MAPHHPELGPDKHEMPADIQRLSAVIDRLPEDVQGELKPVVKELIESTKRRQRVLKLIQEALSVLRLDMKYLMFDLWATRKERDDLIRKKGE